MTAKARWREVGPGRLWGRGDAQGRQAGEDQQDASRHRTVARPAPVAIWQVPTSTRAAVMTHRSAPAWPAEDAHRLAHRAITGRRSSPAISQPRPGGQVSAGLWRLPSPAQAALAVSSRVRLARVQVQGEPGQSVPDLVLRRLRGGPDAQAESWRLHQPYRLGLPEGGLVPGWAARSEGGQRAGKDLYVVPCGLGLAASNLRTAQPRVLAIPSPASLPEPVGRRCGHRSSVLPVR